METLRTPGALLAEETRALLTRLGRVKPFALQEAMLPAAALSAPAQIAIERYLISERRALRDQLRAFLRALHDQDGSAPLPRLHRGYVRLRMQFNLVLSQFDLFSDTITQRSEHETGVWLAGLDAAATDALSLPGQFFEAPPVVCYLDRGPGGAIRRARTRLPGGGENPVALIRVPRERMIGAGVASSLAHEVGHQAAALLDLVTSLRPVLQGLQAKGGDEAPAWRLWERWISEIVADLFAVGRVGVVATLGLMGVVSLPAPFQFRVNDDDPHPIPYIRVKLSCALGHALYPHPQWSRLAQLWEAFYPTAALDEGRQALLTLLERTMPGLVALLVNLRPAALRGRSLSSVLVDAERRPSRLAQLYRSWRTRPIEMRAARPSLALAVLGQARADGALSPEKESRVLAGLLTFWALKNSLDQAAGVRVSAHRGCSGSCAAQHGGCDDSQ